MNHSLDYIEACGPEPDVSDAKDQQRWDKWMAWNRRYAKLFPASNGPIAPDGFVRYDKILRSQATRKHRESRHGK